MKDRYIHGLAAGIVGWLPQFILTMTLYFGFHLTKLRFLDFAGILAFNHKPIGLMESFFSEAIVIGQMAVFGILFAGVIQIIASPNIGLKGAIYGGFCWFSIYVLAFLYKTKGIYGTVDFKTSVSNLFASVIWGIAMAWAFQLLNQKYGGKNNIQRGKGV